MVDEKLASLHCEIDNLNQKIAFLESKLKELESNRHIPSGPFDVVWQYKSVNVSNS